MKSLLLAFCTLLLFTACSQKVNISSFQPAMVDRASKTKKISVLKFDNDYIGFASSLETKLAEKRVLGENYFTVISRDKLEAILKEQKLQYSGLVNKKSAVKVGELIGAQAFISGEIADSSLNKSYYRSKRVECLDKKCKKVREYYIQCVTGDYNLSISIKMSDIELGDIIFADTFTKRASHSSCINGLPNKGHVMSKLSQSIINDFVSKISPSRYNISIELLEEPELDYTDKQEELLEYSLEYIKSNRLDKAEQLLSELLTSLNDKCYVAAYNLGVVKEAQGELKKAKTLYDLADNLVLKPNELINQAVLRIDEQLRNRELVNSQLAQ